MQIYLIDLAHESKLGLGSDTMPLQLGLIGAYCLKNHGDKIKIEIFKSVEEFASAVNNKPPDIIASSNYLWNIDLSYKLIQKIKKDYPNIIVVFGGPNYPDTEIEQITWLKGHPAVDFYVYKDGEVPFSEIVGKVLSGLKSGDIKKLKLNSCHALLNGVPFFGKLESRLKDLNEIPSPYLLGIMDKFFNDKLIPTIQTNRGCPFNCTFCTEGNSYYNVITKTSIERKMAELDYIVKKIKYTKTLRITDSNFGMFEEDVEFCKYISKIQKKFKYPEYINCSTGKNNKERVLQCNELVGNIMRFTASVQSLDAGVLKEVRRVNISVEDMIKISEKTSDTNTHSYSEIILALPNDSLEKEIKTIKDLVNTGIGNITQHQLALIYGTELASLQSRNKHKIKSMFRPIQRCASSYSWGGKKIVAIETEEVCVATDTLSIDDYLRARQLYLTIGLFYNDRIFSEIIALLRFLGIPAWGWLETVHKKATTHKNLREIYNNFSKETMAELWDDPGELKKYVTENLEKYMNGEAGGNLIYKYRAIGIISRFSDLHKIAFSELRKLLICEKSTYLNEIIDEIELLSISSKGDLLNVNNKQELTLNYDLSKIVCGTTHKKGVHELKSLKIPTKLLISHTCNQKETIERQLNFYGRDLGGLTMVFSRFPIERFYRKIIKL